MPAPRPEEALPSLLPGPADALCLDFANTRYWRGSPSPTEDLAGPDGLLAWCESAGGTGDAAALARARWAAAPAAAATAFDAALALREAVFRVFAAGAQGTAPPASDLAALNAALEAAPPRRRLRRGAGAASGWAWEVPAPAGRDGPPVESLLAPVLWSAGDLLTGARRARVRQCANPRCLWLFLDDSKSGNRRWCSMASCGNRAKAHRRYARLRQARD
jgi:predicted RNA-binding Zn ribbon-like protein